MEREQSHAQIPHDLGKELRAAVEARRELGPEMSDYVMEAFLARLQGQIDVRVAQEVDRTTKAKGNAARQKSNYNPTEIVAVSFGIAIPLCAIAGAAARGVGIAAVMVVVLLINLMYALTNRSVQ